MLRVAKWRTNVQMWPAEREKVSNVERFANFFLNVAHYSLV